MSAPRVIRLDQIVEGTGATVDVRLGADGSARTAWFAMDGLPRIEPLLIGRRVAEIPGIVERLCGICPVAHHLAGTRALEALAGASRLTPTADARRRLLHYGAVVQTHAPALAALGGDSARALGGFAHQVVAVAGSDSHFPRCAVPGGVHSALRVSRCDDLLTQVGPALASALDLLKLVMPGPHHRAPTYTGHDVALVDGTGALDLYGDRLRAVAPDGSVTVEGAGPDAWVDLVAESRPGDPAPRPHLRELGREHGTYRVGPVAQLRVPTHLSTPLAEQARQQWSALGGDSAWARAIVALHAVEVIGELLARPELVRGSVLVRPDPNDRAASGQASGWVDGARGLLVHTYRTDDTRLLSGATITTPTMQIESWLADLVQSAISGEDPIGSTSPGHLRGPLETAIREADPCLPCTSSPPGLMSVRLRVADQDDAPVGTWLLESAAPATRAGR